MEGRAWYCPACAEAFCPDADAKERLMTPIEIMQQWQQKLLDAAKAEGKPNPLPVYGADGHGGAETQAAVIAFQKAHNLTVTGQFDDATRAALTPSKPTLSIPPALIELGIETAIDAAIPPSPAKELLMPIFSNIVHLALALLPGLPDDTSKISGAIQALFKDTTDKNAIAGLRDSARFARILADEADKVANALDPSGAIQPPALPTPSVP